MGNCLAYAYSHDNDLCQNQSQWMSRLTDVLPLSVLSIPGTHDTMSLGAGGDIAQTQSKSLSNQLQSGIRFIDIRLAVNLNSSDLLYLNHGPIYLNTTFNNVLDTVTNFLKNNPKETILIRVKQENTNVSDATFASTLQKILSNSKYSPFQYQYDFNPNPKLGNLRGKFVIIQNFGGIFYWMPYTSTFNIQDNYTLNTNWDLYNKWLSVKNQLINANKSYLNNSSTPFINYLSGSGGVFPYFVASGQNSAATGAPLLSTGLTEPFFHSYFPDFPRIGWIGSFANIFYQGTNVLAKAYIDSNKPSYVGIVISDFPGQGLINSIIQANSAANMKSMLR